jgi:cytochrome b
MRQGGPLPSLPWRQGQNLLLPLFIVLILGLIVPLTLSGHATYEAWGGEWLADALAEVHEAMGEALLMTVLAHVAVIAGLSLLRRRNLALPMLTGRHDDGR